MLFDLLTYGGLAALAFAGGAYFGSRNVATVDKAIKRVQAAEQDAKTMLDKITAHKAS